MRTSSGRSSASLAQAFRDRFGAEPQIFGAPGRVNIIGEHTDYNHGFVMPCAIGFTTRVAIARRPDRRLVLHSEAFLEHFEFDLQNLPTHGARAWCDYIVGVAAVLRADGHCLEGANLLVRGEIPIGSGLSSSAAIEVASAMALSQLNRLALSRIEIAKICHRAENEFVGARVGIMDQFVACLGEAEHALLLDCHSLDFRMIPVPPRVQLVICNTMVKHHHAQGEYNRRREECEAGVGLLAQWYPNVRSLRDVSEEQLSDHAHEVPETIYRRCLHVLTENRRVERAEDSLRRGDLLSLGRLMGDSHRSLRTLYEVSCAELDLMVELAQGLPGCYGGRMTGGGFGGCTVNLLEREQAAAFSDEIVERYWKKIGTRPDVYICQPSDGAGMEPLTAVSSKT